MWTARAGFPPGTRAQKNALLAPNHAQRLGAFLCPDRSKGEASPMTEGKDPNRNNRTEMALAWLSMAAVLGLMWWLLAE